MLTLACLAMKGGTGKTTLARALAVAAERAGMHAAIVDLDPQASAATWGDRREAVSPAVIGAQAPRLAPVLEAAHNAGAEIAIIDTAPHASDAALAAAQAADVVLIPCRASVADLAAIRHRSDSRRSRTPPRSLRSPRRRSARPSSPRRGTRSPATASRVLGSWCTTASTTCARSRRG